MSQPPVISSRPSPPRFWWAVPLVGAMALAAIPVGLGLLVWSCLRTGGDAAALRQAAARASQVRWERQVEFSAGRIPVGLIRLALNLAPLDGTARRAVAIPRSAEVAVFHAPRGEAAHAEVLTATDAAMQARRWERMVGIVDDETVVAVYVPRDASDGDDLHACLLVMDGDVLVVASVRANPRPLLELIERHAPQERLVAWKP